MITQTKVLKNILKKHDITGPYGDKLKVRITKTKHGEYGCAEAFVSGLTAEKIELIKYENPRVKIISLIDEVAYITY